MKKRFVSMLFYAVLLCLLHLVTSHPNEMYAGSKLLNLVAPNKRCLTTLEQFLSVNKLESYVEVKRPSLSLQVLVPLQKLFKLKQFCRRERISTTVIINDVKQELDHELDLNDKKFHGTFNYERYNQYGEIEAELHRLTCEYPSLMRVCTVGHSWEGRPLLLVKVSEDVINCQTDNKPIIWIDGGMHGREWISVATGMNVMKQLLDNYHNNETITTLLRQKTFYFVPVFNPDGYVHTFTTDRLWRKTRSNMVHPECYGADPNRNWNVMWAGSPEKPDPCTLFYRGMEAESEPCVHSYASILRRKQKLLQAYFTLHSFFEILLIPNSHSLKPPADIAEICRVSNVFVQAIKRRHNTEFNAVAAPFIFGPTFGVSADYVHDKLNVTHSYIVELRGGLKFRFMLPPDQIKPTGDETYDAIVASVQAIKN